MSEIIDVNRISEELFVPVVLVRDIRRASIEDGKGVILASPMGFSEQTEKEAMRVRFRRLDGKKIKLAGWSRKQPNFVMTPLRELWFACYVPGSNRVSVPRADGKVTVANMKGNKHGDYIVCPATPSKEPDKSRVYVVSNMWFHKMFGFTKEAETRAKKLRAGIKLVPMKQAEGIEYGGREAQAEPKQVVKEPSKLGQAEGFGGPTGEVEVTAERHDMAVSRPKVTYPKVNGDNGMKASKKKAYVGKVGDTFVTFYDYAACYKKGDLVPITAVSLGGQAIAFCNEYDVEKAEVAFKIESGDRKWFVIMLNKYMDSDEGYMLCSPNGLMKLVRSGLIKDVTVVERDGRKFLRGCNGLKLDELRSVGSERDVQHALNTLKRLL